MKKCILLYILFFITIINVIYTMDTPLEKVNKKNRTKEINELILQINATINAQYSACGYSSPYLSLLFLPKKIKTELINTIISRTNSTYVNKVLTVLFHKNPLVKTSIQYFIELILTAIQSVTPSTLNVIESPLSEQNPLYQLPILARTFIMQSAYNTITYNHTINLQHEKPISCFDISEPACLAAIAVTDHLYLWDTKQWIQKHSIPCNALKQIIFNADGSRIIALEQPYNNSYSLHGIDTQQGICLWEIKSNGLPYHIQFAHDTRGSVLAITSKKNSAAPYTQSLWQLDTNTPVTLGKTTLPIARDSSIIDENNNKISKGNYCARYSKLSSDKTTLLITKKNCHALYLCIRAIKNSSAQSNISGIEQSQSYQSLTPFEKQIIKGKIQKKEQP